MQFKNTLLLSIRIIKANLIYTTNGGHRYEEWFKADAKNHAKQFSLKNILPVYEDIYTSLHVKSELT